MGTLTIPSDEIVASTYLTISLASMRRMVNRVGIACVFLASNEAAEHQVFATVHNGAVMYADANGFTDFNDAVDAAAMGIEDGNNFRFAKRITAASADELQQFQAAVASTLSELDELLTAGYEDAYESYVSQNQAAGRSTRLLSLGAFLIRYVPQFKERGGAAELIAMLEFGTEEVEEYDRATEAGFTSLAAMKRAKALKLANNAELEEFEAIGFTESLQFHAYCALRDEAEEAGHASLPSYLVSQCLEGLASGQSIGFAEIARQVHEILNKKRIGAPAAVPGVQELITDPEKIYQLHKQSHISEGYAFDAESSRITKRWFTPAEEKSVVLDVSNIAWTNATRDEGEHASAENVTLVVRALQEFGFEHIIGIADASLPHDVQHEHDLQEIRESLDLTIVKGNQSADPHILEIAEKRQAVIVSNDRFREWVDRNTWAKANLERVRISFEIHDRTVSVDQKLSTKRRGRKVFRR